MDVKDYLGIIWRQKVIVILATILVFGIWYYNIWYKEPLVYSASAKTFQALYTPQEYIYSKFVESMPPYVSLAARMEFATSEQVAKKAAEYLITGAILQEEGKEEVKISAHPNMTYSYVMSSIYVPPVGREQPQMFLITATSITDGQEAVDIANAVAFALKYYLKEYATSKLEGAIKYANNVYEEAKKRQEKEKNILSTKMEEMGVDPFVSTGISDQLKYLNDKKATLDQRKIEIEGQVMGITARLKEVEQKVENVKQGTLIVDIYDTKEIKELNTKISDELTKLRELELTYQFDHPSIVSTIRKITYMRFQLEEEKKRLDEQRPKVIENRKAEEIAEGQKYIATLKEEESAKTIELDNINKNIDSVKTEISAKEESLKNLQGERSEYLKKRDVYLEQQKVFEEAKAETSRLKKDVEDLERKRSLMPELLIVESPAKTASNMGKQSTAQLPFIVLLSIVVGVGLGYIRDYLDDRVRTPYDIKRYMNWAVLGTIPYIRKDAERFIKDAAVKSPLFEVFGRMAAVLNTLIQKDNSNAFTVVSTSEKEGKSTIATNLATAFARMGKETLLIDCDMRRPTLHRTFGVDNSTGLSTYLSGKFAARAELRKIAKKPVEVVGEGAKDTDVMELTELPPEENVNANNQEANNTTNGNIFFGLAKHTKTERLSLIPSGPVPANPVALLDSDTMRELVKAAKGKYSVVVIDSPPIESTTDPLILSSIVDYTTLTVACWSTKKYQLTWAKRMLEDVGARMAGVILNKATIQHKGYYYYYYQTKSYTDRS